VPNSEWQTQGIDAQITELTVDTNFYVESLLLD